MSSHYKLFYRNSPGAEYESLAIPPELAANRVELSKAAFLDATKHVRDLFLSSPGGIAETNLAEVKRVHQRCFNDYLDADSRINYIVNKSESWWLDQQDEEALKAFGSGKSEDGKEYLRAIIARLADEQVEAFIEIAPKF